MGAQLTDAQRIDPRLCVDGIGLESGLLSDAVLGEAVNEVDVGPNELNVGAEGLEYECAVVDEELEVQRGDIPARVASARGIEEVTSIGV